MSHSPMIITCKKKIPFLWIVLAALPWVAMLFKDKLMGAAFTASMKKYVDNPAALSFVLGIAPLASWLVPTLVGFYADRIWTRFGRRKPFILLSWCGTITCIFCMPLAPSFPVLIGLYVAFVICNDLGTPAEALKMEVVPPSQRALSTAVVHWINQVGVIVYFWVALGRFDEVTVFLDRHWTGQQGLFWTVALAMVVMLMFLMLGIKEVDPKSSLRGKFGFFDFFRGLFSPHIWPLYVLTFSTAFTGAGIGAFDYLLLTEQWGYTNQDVGNNIVIGGVINLFLIPLIGMIANRTGRFRVYITLISLGIAVNIFRYCYYEYVLYDGRPTILEMVFFGEMFSILGILTSIALVPLVYDYISRNELGTYSAGAGLVGRGSGIFLTMLMGAFVPIYATLFLAPAGPAVRVSVHRDLPQGQVEKVLQTQAAGTNLTLTARPVYATGAKLNHGYGFEVRMKDADSEKLRAERDAADNERSAARARARYATDRAKAKPDQAATLLADAAREQAIVAEKSALVTARETDLQRRADEFQKQVNVWLRDILLPDGGQILNCGTVPAVVVALPLAQRPAVEDVEATLDKLRQELPAVIDLRVVTEPTRAIEVSLAGNDADAARQALLAAATPGLKACLADLTPTGTRNTSAIQLDLRTLEDPLDRHPSPIMKGLEFFLGRIIGRHDPERRLRAIGRGLRRPGWIDHAHAATVDGDERAVRVVALVGAAPAGEKPKPEEQPSPAVLAKLATLGEADAVRAAGLYSVTVRAAKAGRMTIARPILQASYAKQQYDYLAGYLAVFVLQLIGVGIIVTFVRMVKAGRITKRGVAEAEATR
jgi:Na+/melibiose symporter-like transporter